MIMRSSKAAFDLIVAEEVTSQAVYSKKYRKPEWPGASSGATVGIGYDLGQTARATITADWKGRVSNEMLTAMLSASGITGEAAKPVARRLRSVIDIPWDVALAVHKECVIPRWEAKVAAALPNTDKLSPDCFGSLLSLTFNRGPSFNNSGERYREMRAIKAHMAAEHFDQIPGDFRAMKRLWPNLAGLRRRRDAEAALFTVGLKAMADVPQGIMGDAGRPPRTDDVVDDPPPVGDVEDDPVPAATRSAPATPVTAEVVQRRLEAMGYFPGVIGTPPGGITAGAIAGFKNDRRMTGEPVIDDALLAELDIAEAEGFKRPIATARATATEATLAPKNEGVRANWWSRQWAKVLAIPSAIGAAISGAMDNFPTAKSYIEPVMNFFTDMPGWVWFVAAGAIGGGIWLSTRKAGEAMVDDYREARRL